MMISCAFYKLISIVMFPPLCSTSNYLDNFKLPTGNKIISSFLYNQVELNKPVALYYYEDDQLMFLSVKEKVVNILINTFKNRHSFYLIKNNKNNMKDMSESAANFYVCDEQALFKDEFVSLLKAQYSMNILITISNDTSYCNDYAAKQFFKDNPDVSSTLLIQYCQLGVHGAFRFVHKSDGLSAAHKLEVDNDLEDNYKRLIERESTSYVNENIQDVFNLTTYDILYGNKDNRRSQLLKNTQNYTVKYNGNYQYTFPVHLKNCLDYVNLERCVEAPKHSQLMFIIFAVGLGLLIRMSSKIVWALEVVTYTKKLIEDDGKKKWFDLELVTLYSIFLRQPVKIKLSTLAQVFFVSSVLLTSLISYGYFYSNMLQVSKMRVKSARNPCIRSIEYLQDNSAGNETSFVYAFRKNNPNYFEVNHKVLQMVETGLIDKSAKDRCIQKYFKRFQKDKMFLSNSRIQFTLGDYKDSFLILFSGLFLSCLVFVYQIMTTESNLFVKRQAINSFGNSFK